MINTGRGELLRVRVRSDRRSHYASPPLSVMVRVRAIFWRASRSSFMTDDRPTATVKPLERRINQMTRVTRKATPTKRAGLESAATPLLFLGSERGGRVMGYAGSKCSTCVLLCAPDGRNGWFQKYRAHPVRYLACSKPSIVFVNIK